jgi:hypothetical protein
MNGVSDDKRRISKIEAARRQLDCAIELWFMDGDDVSIHTLAGAAYQIIHDLKEHRGEVRPLLYDADQIKDEYRNQWINLVKRAVNFFKHADKNPDDTVVFSPSQNMLFLMSAAGGIRLLGEQTSHAVNAFTFWMVINKPTWITPQFRKLFEDRISVEDLQEFKTTISKKDFFEIYTDTSAGRRTAIARGNIRVD